MTRQSILIAGCPKQCMQSTDCCCSPRLQPGAAAHRQGHICHPWPPPQAGRESCAVHHTVHHTCLLEGRCVAQFRRLVRRLTGETDSGWLAVVGWSAVSCSTKAAAACKQHSHHENRTACCSIASPVSGMCNCCSHTVRACMQHRHDLSVLMSRDMGCTHA